MNLSNRILLFFLPLALAAGVGLTVLTRREVSRILNKQVSEQGASIAQDLAQRGREALAAGDEARLLPLLQSTLSRGALYALAMDTEGRVAAHTNVAEKGKVYRDPAVQAALAPGGPAAVPTVIPAVTASDEPILEVTVPVGRSSGDDEEEEDLLSSMGGGARPRGGLLRVGMSLRNALQTEARIAQRVFLVVAGIGALGLGLTMFLIHRVLQPVHQLDRATERLAKGEFGVEVPGEGPDELGRLAASFNRLSRDLKNQITERQKTQEQLLQSQKMETVGQLAGGVAHDFNNILTVIQGFVYLMMEHPGNPAVWKEGLDQVRLASERASSLTRQLLAFSRKQVLQPVVLCLNSLIKNMEKMTERLVGESVKFELSLDPGLGFVKADPGQLEQVVLNLVVNARDAMPQGGRVFIETANVVSPGTNGLPAGNWVRLTVKDTGVGMTDEVKTRIFEPFFTTKGVGKGTGLGLSTVMGIVQQTGGHLVLDTAPGQGSAFHIHLPASVDVAPPAAEEAAAWPAGGTETILMVEDDPHVRLFTRRVLEQKGYTLVEADGPDAALSAMSHYGSKLDLLLTDVMMAGMNGRVLSEMAASRCPGLKVLFMSGHTEDALLLSGIRSRDKAFLEKPFTPEKLLRKVREVLEERRVS